MKELKLKIKTCMDCPYSSQHESSLGHFKCSYSISTRIKGHYCFSNQEILPFCPLKDARGQGVLVGVSLILLNEKNQILVGHRKNASSGNNSWGLPGGGMDAGEKPKETGIREVKEETSLEVVDIDALEFANFTNDSFMEESGEHWITLYYLCRFNNWQGLPKRVEPHKCQEWRWCDLDNLPQPIFCDWDKNIEFLKAMI